MHACVGAWSVQWQLCDGGMGSEEQAEEEGKRIRCGAKGKEGSATPLAQCELILPGTPRHLELLMGPIGFIVEGRRRSWRQLRLGAVDPEGCRSWGWGVRPRTEGWLFTELLRLKQTGSSQGLRVGSAGCFVVGCDVLWAPYLSSSVFWKHEYNLLLNSFIWQLLLWGKKRKGKIGYLH